MKRLLAPLAVGLAAWAQLANNPDAKILFGLERNDFIRAAILAAILVWMILGLAARTRASELARIVLNATTWASLIIALTGLYAYREDFAAVANRVAAEFFPGEPVIGPGGEVTINRRLNGQFFVTAKVNGAPVKFLFDTGASSVVLTMDDAKRVGVDVASLSFDVGVSTANGSAEAAETHIDKIAVGPISLKNVRALVAKPGALAESLLGMSFLERLKSYGVEKGKLVLKGN